MAKAKIVRKNACMRLSRAMGIWDFRLYPVLNQIFLGKFISVSVNKIPENSGLPSDVRIIKGVLFSVEFPEKLLENTQMNNTS